MPSPAASTYIEAIRHLPVGSALNIPDVSWAEYEELLAELGADYSVRVTYDHGRLEIASPSTKHEKWKDFVLLAANLLAGELGKPFESFGSATFKHPGFRQGAEPDTCFYVQHAGRVIGKDDLDLAIDPPPDVVVEIDVSHSSERKRALYAKLGVPEVWRYDGERASIYQLSGQAYTEVAASLAFPPLRAEALAALLHRMRTDGQQTALDAFRQSLRSR